MKPKTSSDSKANAEAALAEFDRLTGLIDAAHTLRDSLKVEIAEIEQRFDPGDSDTAQTLAIRREQLRGVDPYLGRLAQQRNIVHSELSAHFECEQRRIASLAEAVLSRTLAESTQRMANAFPDSDRAECHRLAIESPAYRQADSRLRRIRGAVFDNAAVGC